MPPMDFIPVAEETGLVVPLGRHVLREATKTVAEWQRRLPQHRDLQVAVNLSGRQFQAAGLREDVALALDESGLDPRSLVLEVTESVMLLHDPDLMAERFRELRELGVRIAIDDFGTGFSALSYLRTLPADLLKIDRSFVQGIAHGQRDSAIVRSMIELGRTLGLTTIAEGIETEEHRAVLHRLGCDLAQGFLFARPMSGADMQALLAAGPDDATLRLGESEEIAVLP